MANSALEERVRPWLTEKRFAHTLRTRDMAVRLARRWGADEDLTEQAALLHDITKKCTDDEQLKLCKKYGIIVHYREEEFHQLIHADTAACVARDVFHAGDAVCRAIALHTLGAPGMGLMDKIVYLADAVEEGRDYPGVRELREEAFLDLDRAVLHSLERTVDYVRACGREPNQQSAEAAAALRAAIQRKENIMELKNLEPKELLIEIVKIADSRKARDVVAVEVTEQTTLADYFVIMTGTSTTHIRALADEIEYKMKENFGIYPHHTEGVTSNWILLDYSTVVVNIFLSDSREMYALERMWGDSHPVDISKYLTAE